jgi:hypothetical protein
MGCEDGALGICKSDVQIADASWLDFGIDEIGCQ